MVNAKFRIVDPSQGHECSVDNERPQWIPPNARSTSDGQQSPAAELGMGRPGNVGLGKCADSVRLAEAPSSSGRFKEESAQ